MTIKIQEDLRRRLLPDNRPGVFIDEETDTATFLLYSLSGKMAGYIRYNPNASKEKNNNYAGRYFIFAAYESDKTHQIALWGVDTLHIGHSFVFVTEGVFDANRLHLEGYPAIAILSNNSRAAPGFFGTLPCKTIAIMDNDGPGQALGKLTDYAFTVPDPYHDLDDMPQDEVRQFVLKILGEIGR